MQRSTLAFLAAALLLLTALPALAGEAPGTLSFKANNKMYNADGKFEDWKITEVNIPDGDLTQGTATLEVDLASVWEKSSQLADHLRTADFFDVAKYTTATVKIHGISKSGENTYDGTASVTFHGHTNDVPISFEVTGTEPLQVKGTATLQRTAFGIGGPYDPSNDRSIVDDIAISLDATLSH